MAIKHIIKNDILYRAEYFEETDNGIRYDWWIDGPQGAKFDLFPVRLLNDSFDIIAAKKQLYHERDVVSIRITWIELSKENVHELLLLDILRINKSGYAGLMPNGNIVDRRKYPDAIPIQENKSLNIPKPIKL